MMTVWQVFLWSICYGLMSVGAAVVMQPRTKDEDDSLFPRFWPWRGPTAFVMASAVWFIILMITLR